MQILLVHSSIALDLPEVLHSLGLPFGNPYQSAQRLHGRHHPAK